MPTSQAPMIVARGMYLGPTPEGKVAWLATPREQLEFPKEMDRYLTFASDVLTREEAETLFATLEHGGEAIAVLSEAGVIIELPADVEGSLEQLVDKTIYPLGIRMSVTDSAPGSGRFVHDVTVRRPNTDETVILRHPLSTVMEDLEHDVAGAIQAVADSTGEDLADVLNALLGQLSYAIGERVGYLSDSGYDNG